MKKLLIIFLSIIPILASSQWIKQTSNTTDTLRSICFTNENTGFVVGDIGTILKTTDGGTVWTNISSGTSKNLNSVDFPNEDIGFVVGDGGIILKTIDGGSTWSPNLSAGLLGNFYSVKFQELNKGWVTTSEGFLLRTLNGGSTWYILGPVILAPIYSASFIDTTTGYVVGSASDKIGFIIKTFEYLPTFIPQSGTGLFSVFFPTDSTGYAAGMYGTVVKTNDAGSTWNILQHDTGTFFYSTFFTDKNTGWIAGSDGLIKKTIDGGYNWLISLSGISEELKDIYFLNADTGYAVGANGTILKTTTGGIVSVENKKPAEPAFMVYPNPASDKIIIIPKKKSSGKIIVTMTNLIGKQEIYKTFQDQGIYELDVSSYLEGVYFLKIQSQTGFEYKKLVIK